MSFLDRWRNGPTPVPTVTPIGASGRGHTDGFIDYEELNNDLIGQQGYQVFDQMYRTDGDVRQVVQLVCNPLVSGTWGMVPFGGQDASERARYLADFAHWALFTVMSPNLIGHLAEMLPILARSGFTPYEKIWMRETYKGKTVVVPRKLDVRLPRTIFEFKQDKFGELVSIIQQLAVPLFSQATDGPPSTGIAGKVEIPREDMVFYRVGGEGDNWEGISLLRPAYKHWKLKDAIERIDAVAQEREAMGVPICYPPLGVGDAQLDAMEDVLGNMRTNEQGYIIAPGPKAGSGAPEGQGWLIEILGYDRTGSGRDPMPSLEYHTQKIAAAFIAEFMRLGHGGSGSRATAQVQVDPFQMGVEAFTTMIEQVINDQLVKPLIAYNFPDETEIPSLKMSQVDSTSLTQLADYILKLTQVGAVLPDQPLEDFLRARADLPPADPELVRDRKATKDEKTRREIVTGGGMNGDAFGAGANKAGGTDPTAGKHGIKDAPIKDAKSTLSRSDSMTEPAIIGYHRPLRDAEKVCNLDDIEEYLDALPTAYDRRAGGDARRVAWAHAASGHDTKAKQSQHLGALRSTLLDCLHDDYGRGAADVQGELSRLQDHKSVVLSATTIRDRGRAGLQARADHAAKTIDSRASLMSQSMLMNHGDVPHLVRGAAEKEAGAALRYVARHHGQGAYMQGRHDTILAASAANPFGVLYTAVLDHGTCQHCDEADDGVVRSLDDPVRLDRRPPNRHCESTASGHNQCRCLEIPALME